MAARPAALILGGLVTIFIGLGLVQATQDAPTVDEAVDVAAGLVAVAERDLRMNPEHGLLHHALPAVLPWVVADPLIPRTTAYDEGDWFDYTADLVEANDQAGRFGRVLFWFRVAPLLAGAVTGMLLYALAARLLGRAAGLVAALLWLSTPYFLGLAHLSSVDVSFACAVVALALLVDRFRTTPSTRALLALSGGLGAAMLVRHNAIVLVPVVALVVFATGRHDRRRALLGVAVVLLVPLALVWGAYRVVDPVPVDGPPRERFDGLIGAAMNEGPIEALALAVPMPVEWRAGFAYLVVTAGERPAYLLGEYWEGSRPWFFPISSLVKIPASFWLATAAGAVGWRRTSRRLRVRALTAAGSIGVVLGVFLVAQPLNLGLRLAVPVLALLPIAGAAVTRLPRRVAIAAVGVVAVQLPALVASHPTSLAWTPPPFTDGYRFVSDSSIDFGQANEAIRTEHEHEPFVAATLLAPRGYDPLFGVPTVGGVSSRALVGRVAVSATALMILQRGELSWLRAYCPVEVIGGAVLLYRFDEAPNTDAGPDVPAAPCDGAVSRRR